MPTPPQKELRNMGKFKIGDRVVEDKSVGGLDLVDHWNTYWRKGEGELDGGAFVVTQLLNGGCVSYSNRVGGSGPQCEANYFKLAPATLTIEAGKFYKTRDGRKVGPIVKAQWGYGPDWLWSVEHPFVASSGKAWRADGTFSTVAGRSDEADLVAEWVDESKVGNDNGGSASLIGKSVTVQIAKPKIKVGDRVRFKQSYGLARVRGMQATVVSTDGWGIRIDSGPGEGVSTEHADSIELVTAAPTPTAIVCLIENGHPKPSSTPHIHADEAKAGKEAARLASVYKGKEFGVFVLTSSTSQPAPVYKHEWQRQAVAGNKISAIKELRAANDLTLKGAKDAVEHWLETAA
jgi:hypothetical protein